jgi:hypothetical protein
MVALKSLSPSEYIALANAAAFVLIDGKNSDDTINIGDFISLVGDIIVAAGAQRARIEQATSKNNKSTSQGTQNNTEIISTPL